MTQRQWCRTASCRPCSPPRCACCRTACTGARSVCDWSCAAALTTVSTLFVIISNACRTVLGLVSGSLCRGHDKGTTDCWQRIPHISRTVCIQKPVGHYISCKFQLSNLSINSKGTEIRTYLKGYFSKVCKKNINKPPSTPLEHCGGDGGVLLMLQGGEGVLYWTVTRVEATNPLKV